MLTSRCELITTRRAKSEGRGLEVENGCSGGCTEVAYSPATSGVFHWINVTGERRLRFNYYANLRFNRACATRSGCIEWDVRRPGRERNGLEKWSVKSLQ